MNAVNFQIFRSEHYPIKFIYICNRHRVNVRRFANGKPFECINVRERFLILRRNLLLMNGKYVCVVYVIRASELVSTRFLNGNIVKKCWKVKEECAIFVKFSLIFHCGKMNALNSIILSWFHWITAPSTGKSYHTSFIVTHCSAIGIAQTIKHTNMLEKRQHPTVNVVETAYNIHQNQRAECEHP